MNDIRKALPAAQEAVCKEIRARIGGGEEIASMKSTEMVERSKAVLHQMQSSPLPKKSAA